MVASLRGWWGLWLGWPIPGRGVNCLEGRENGGAIEGLCRYGWWCMWTRCGVMELAGGRCGGWLEIMGVAEGQERSKVKKESFMEAEKGERQEGGSKEPEDLKELLLFFLFFHFARLF